MKITNYDQIWDLWTAYRDAMRAYVLKKTKDPEVTKDLTHDILLKIHKTCCSEKEIKNVRSWLFQIAYNIMMDHFNLQNKKKSSEVSILELTQDDMYQEMAEYIEPLISFLPEKYAIPLRMSDIEGLKQQDIAETLKQSLTATKSQIQRGRKLLKAEIHSCFHIKAGKTSGLIDFDVKQSCITLQEIIHKKK